MNFLSKTKRDSRPVIPADFMAAEGVLFLIGAEVEFDLTGGEGAGSTVVVRTRLALLPWEGSWDLLTAVAGIVAVGGAVAGVILVLTAIKWMSEQDSNQTR